MNKKLKYSSIFILFTVLVIIASGLVAATDINDTVSTDISENTFTNTLNDESISSSQTDNNIESQTIANEVDTNNDYETDNTTTTSESKELIKNDKNLKSARDYTGTLTLTPNKGIADDTVTGSLSGLSVFAGTYTTKVYWDGVEILSGSGTASKWNAPPITFTVPSNATPGEHTVKYSCLSNRNYHGTATFTVEKVSVPTTMDDMEAVTGEIGNTVIPVTVHDIDGNSLTGSSNITIVDNEDNILVENYPIENGVASISVPTNKLGT